MILYMMVTNDKYELPIAVADNAHELADMLGIKHGTVHSLMWRARKLHIKCQYIKVEIDEEEE